MAAQPVTVIALVGLEKPGGRHLLDQGFCGGAVSHIARRQHEDDRPTVPIAQRTDLGGAPAATAADGLGSRPLYRRRAALGRQRVENLRPHLLRRPTDKAVVERLVRAIQIARRIPPAAATLQNMHDPGDHAVVVSPYNAPRVPRQMRQNPCELRLRKPEKAISHRQTAFNELESQKRHSVKPIYGS